MCKSLLHFVLVFKLGMFYGAFHRPVYPFLFRFRAWNWLGQKRQRKFKFCYFCNRVRKNRFCTDSIRTSKPRARWKWWSHRFRLLLSQVLLPRRNRRTQRNLPLQMETGRSGKQRNRLHFLRFSKLSRKPVPQ